MDWSRSPEDIPRRGEVLGFAERTRRNLDYVHGAYEGGEPVHLVTQVVLSLLGIVVFPWERHGRALGFDRSLAELEALGWPAWQAKAGSYPPKKLDHLVRRLRNATAHNNIAFDSDSRDPAKVNVSFTSYNEDETWQWTGIIRADRLLVFCHLFLQQIDEYIG